MVAGHSVRELIILGVPAIDRRDLALNLARSLLIDGHKPVSYTHLALSINDSVKVQCSIRSTIL